MQIILQRKRCGLDSCVIYTHTNNGASSDIKYKHTAQGNPCGPDRREAGSTTKRPELACHHPTAVRWTQQNLTNYSLFWLSALNSPLITRVYVSCWARAWRLSQRFKTNTRWWLISFMLHLATPDSPSSPLPVSPLSDSVAFYRQPGSYCAKPAWIWFGFGCLRQVLARQSWSGSKPVCKNHQACFWPVWIGCESDLTCLLGCSLQCDPFQPSKCTHFIITVRDKLSFQQTQQSSHSVSLLFGNNRNAVSHSASQLFSNYSVCFSVCVTPFWQQQECLFLTLFHSFLATTGMLVSHSASFLSGNNRNACFSLCFTVILFSLGNMATTGMLISHSASLLSGNNSNACFSLCFTPFWQQQECLFLTLLHSFLATTGMLVSHSASLFLTLFHSFLATTVMLVSHLASLLYGNNRNACFSLCFTPFWQQQ